MVVLVEVRPVGLGECVGQALAHGWVHDLLCGLLGVKPCCGGGLLVIGLGVAGWAKSVEAHRELLVDPLPAWVGQHVARVAVHPCASGDLDGDTGLLSDFAGHRRRGGLSDFDPASGQFPVPVIRGVH